jgi:hypothetical protein
MSESTLAILFKDLVTKIARESGLAYFSSTGQSKALPPIDVHDLAEIKESINDGIRMFMADEPVTGWRWRRRIASIQLTGTRITGTADSASSTTVVDLTLASTYDADDDLKGYYVYITGGTGEGSYAVVTGYTALTGTVTVADWLDAYGNAGGTDPAANSTFAITPIETVGGDIHRYPLPETFAGEIDGTIRYGENSNLSSPIEWVDELFIRSRRSISAETGYPRYAALRPLEPYEGGSLGPKRRIELIVDPTPNADIIVEFPYTITFNKLDCETGEADSGGDTTLVDATRTEGDDYFNGWKISIINGTGLGSYALVTDYTGATGTFTVADWLKSDGTAGGTNPGANSIYYIEPLNNLHPAGQRFDETIIAACMSKAQQKWPDIMSAGSYIEEYHKKALLQARIIDGRLAPRGLGTMNRRREPKVRIRNSNYVEFN